MHWEAAAASSLEQLEQLEDVDRSGLRRRQARALSRMAAVDVLGELVDAGVLPRAVAEQAGVRVAGEIDEAGA